eukprot:182800-Amphidinium_carterae.1
MPLLIYCSGLDCVGEIKDTRVQQAIDTSQWKSGSFLLLSPSRRKSRWWKVDNSKVIGSLLGDLDSDLVHNLHQLIDAVATHRLVDPMKIFLLWFAADAYAISELLAHGRPLPARAIVLGGLHEHGDSAGLCESLDIPPKYTNTILKFVAKWETYLVHIASRRDHPLMYPPSRQCATCMSMMPLREDGPPFSQVIPGSYRSFFYGQLRPGT